MKFKSIETAHIDFHGRQLFQMHGKTFRETLSQMDQVKHDSLMAKAKAACARELADFFLGAGVNVLHRNR